MDSEGILKCPICRSPSDDLRLLSCTHSYCTACLETWLKQRQCKSGRITCPECRQVTAVPPGGVEMLPKGISMRVAQQLILETQKSSSGSAAKSCQFCEVPEINSWCMQCHRFLCQNCAETHCQRAAFRAHQLEPAVIGVFCEAHEGENGEYYCYECSRPMCARCFQEEEHQHEVVKVQRAYEDIQHRVEAISPELRSLDDNLHKMQSAFVDLNFPELIARKHREAKEKVNRVAQEAIDKIKNWEQDTLNALFHRVEVKKKTYDAKMEDLNTVCAIGKTLLEHMEAADSSTILKDGLTLPQKVKHIRSLHDELVGFVPETVAFAPTGKALEFDFGDIKEEKLKAPHSVKRLPPRATQHPEPEYVNLAMKPKTASEPPSMKTPRSPPGSAPKSRPTTAQRSVPATAPKSPRPAQEATCVARKTDCTGIRYPASGGVVTPEVISIAFGPNQSVIAADITNGMLFRYASDGVLEVLVPPGTMQPRGLAVGPDGKIYTCDAQTKTVWIFNEQGHTIATWPKSELSFPKGIAILRNGDVVVADRDLCKVFIYNPSGGLRRSFGQKGEQTCQLKCPGFIAADAMDRILVSDYGTKAIKVFRANSTFLFSIPLNWPQLKDFFTYQSFCTDGAGNIYVAQKTQMKVVKLDKHGQYLGPHLSAQGPGRLQAPCALAMDRSGLMAVSEITDSARDIKIVKLF